MKMMKMRFGLGLAVIVLGFMACSSGGGGGNNNNATTTNYNISGRVQKGPFNNGTDITIYELQNNLVQTGRNFSTQISDNSGSFNLSTVPLASQYVDIAANGFYYNEVLGANSESPLTLYALSEVTGTNTNVNINVNLLSTLERDRAKYLISQGTITSISDAKKQAEKDMLGIFSITKNDIANSESLDISADTDDNAILLAISVILQGYRSTADLSELLANISTDIRTDGILNSSDLGTQLINDAKLLNLATIRTNLVNHYSDLGVSATIPNFEQYVNQFITNTSYVFNKYPTYPQTGTYGVNLLYGTNDITVPANGIGAWYDLAANLPLGTSLKIILKLNAGQVWGYAAGSPINWNVSSWNGTDQTFTAVESGKTCGIQLDLRSGLSFIIEYYENNSTTPTRTKTVTVS